MLKIRASKNALIVLAFVAIMIMAGCTWMYYNRSAKLSAMEAEVKQKEDLLANSKRTAKRLSDIQAVYNDDQAKLDVLEKGVSSKAYVPTLLRQLEDLGKSSNLRVVGVRPKPPVAVPVQVANGPNAKSKKVVKSPDPYDRLELDIEVNGKYWDVVKFLRKITYFPKIVAVNNIQVNPAAGDPKKSGSPMLTAKVSATAFILKDEQKIGSSKTFVQNSART